MSAFAPGIGGISAKGAVVDCLAGAHVPTQCIREALLAESAAALDGVVA